jgi:hypothetical protein
MEYKLLCDGSYYLVSVNETIPEVGSGMEPSLTILVREVGDAEGRRVPEWAAEARKVDDVQGWINEEMRAGGLSDHAYEKELSEVLSGNLSATVTTRLVYIHSSECSNGECEYLADRR